MARRYTIQCTVSNTHTLSWTAGGRQAGRVGAGKERGREEGGREGAREDLGRREGT